MYISNNGSLYKVTVARWYWLVWYASKINTLPLWRVARIHDNYKNLMYHRICININSMYKNSLGCHGAQLNQHINCVIGLLLYSDQRLIYHFNVFYNRRRCGMMSHDKKMCSHCYTGVIYGFIGRQGDTLYRL